MLRCHSGNTHTPPLECRRLLDSGGFLLGSHSPPPDLRPTHSGGRAQTGNGRYGCSSEHRRRTLDSFGKLELQNNTGSAYLLIYIYMCVIIKLTAVCSGPPVAKLNTLTGAGFGVAAKSDTQALLQAAATVTRSLNACLKVNVHFNRISTLAARCQVIAY